MHRFVEFLVGCLAFSAVRGQNQIVGGYDAGEGEFPYQVSLRNDDFHFCGGSLINDQWVLTAAHCVEGESSENVTAVVGTNLLSEGGDRYEVEELIPHPQYVHLLVIVINDIALIKLKTKVTYSAKVKMIIPSEANVKADEELTLSGWGLTSYPGDVPDKLQTIKLKSISNLDCSIKSTGVILPSDLCTFTKIGEGACYGDSGSPLTLNGQQVGIVSRGNPCAKGKPDVFTRVESYLDWIKSYIN